ncbi:hypothetical protein R4Y45_02840 [Holzapfeliella sp. He02]|uniref:Bacteriocin-associated integral membrane protein n=1 Tax=Holzapfeliella saturejae TaxID=3082953 RepID=A0ABU8SFK1_9LACO
MKRLFVFVSFLCLSIFLAFSINASKEVLYYADYPSVIVKGLSKTKEVANREKLVNQLQQLGQESNSLIARRVVAPNDQGVQRFTYDPYGTGSLPVGLNRATQEEANSSSLANSYLIVSGSLTARQLEQKMNESGYETKSYEGNRNLFDNILYVSINETTFISLLIFVLTFIGTSLVVRIKRLRYAGIELVSGKSILKIVIKPVHDDFLTIMGSIILTTSLGFGLLSYLHVFSWKLLGLLTVTLLTYGTILLFLSIILTLIEILSLKRSSLMRVIKGSLPTKSLMATMLVSQFLSIMMLILVMIFGLKFYSDYQDLAKSEQKWEQYPNYYNATFGLGGGEEDIIKYYTPFQELATDAITNHDAILIKKNYQQPKTMEQQMAVMEDKSRIESLYVNLNYLNHEDIEIGSEFQNKVSNFQEGDFALVLPKKLTSQKQAIVEKYKAEIQDYASETSDIKSNKLYSVKEPLVEFVEDNQERFLFNKSNLDGLQFAIDPVMVVINDKSISRSMPSYFFWGIGAINDVYYKNYDETIALLKKYQVYQEVSYLENIKFQYLNNTMNLELN